MTEAPRVFGPEIQAAIYLRGLGAATPDFPTRFAELETRAKAEMTPEAFAYIAGGAGLETTMEANRAALQRVEISPHMRHGFGRRAGATPAKTARLAP